MPSTYHQLRYHVTFSTQQRRPLITGHLLPALHAYLGGILRNLQATGASSNKEFSGRAGRVLAGARHYIRRAVSGWICDPCPGSDILEESLSRDSRKKRASSLATFRQPFGLQRGNRSAVSSSRTEHVHGSQARARPTRREKPLCLCSSWSIWIASKRSHRPGLRSQPSTFMFSIT